MHPQAGSALGTQIPPPLVLPDVQADAPAVLPDAIPCRLCGATAGQKFQVVFLRNIPVKLYECAGCGSLQTNFPTWLDRAYADLRPVRDVWMVSRTERMRALVVSVLRLLGPRYRKVYDWGGGNGLLVRMLRDLGIDAYRADLYVDNYYSVGFDVEEGSKADLMTAFEVFEHSDDPRKLMREMSAFQPEAILLSTELYRGQGEDWSYIHKDAGKHVFFYTEQAMNNLAGQFGYRCITTNKLSLMHKESPGALRERLLRRLLSHMDSYYRWLKVVDSIVIKSRRGFDADFRTLQERGLI
jgi:hypothetical protein